MTPRKGDLVRVTYEGRYFPYTDYATVETPDGLALAVPADATIEVLEDLRPGDVYRDAEDDVAAYLPDGGTRPWLVIGIRGCVRAVNVGERAYDEWLYRPLTLLVRDGKPVAP
jgi:hypothetical protein